MKKLITAAVASAFAFLAIGAGVLPSGTSLEELTAGNALDPTKDDSGTGSDSVFWLLTGDENADLLVTNYVAASYEPRPEQFSGANNNFLKIDTTGRLYRSISANDGNVGNFDTVTIKDGIYLDTLVQFTAADDQFKSDAITEGDKIAISYVERDADSVDDGETPYTNFVVRAAYVDAANSKIVATNYFLTFPGQPANEVQFDKTAWHRLTVRAISNVGNAYAPVGFVVYVDGTNLVYDTSVAAGDSTYVGSLNPVAQTYFYNSETHALLPSLLRYGETGYNTLAAVAFNGNGCVDDISFTATKPGTLPSEGTAVTIAWDANVATYTVAAGETTLIDGEVVSGVGATNLLLDTSVETLTVTATYATGYEAGKWTVTGSGASISGSTFTVAPGAQLNIVSMVPLFQVGETHYGTFAEALTAAVAAGTELSPATIKLLANYNNSISFSTGYIVLDLNGKTLQGGDSSYYTINNRGAELTIIDSASGGTVLAPTKVGAEGAFYTDAGLTTINAGTFESTVYTEKFQDPEATGDIVVNGGVFYDPDYDPEDVDSKFYLYDYLADGVKATYDASYFTVGSPIIGTYSVTVTPTANATYAAAYNDSGAAVEFVSDVAAVTVGKTITITASPKSGYEYAEQPTGWTLSGGVITIEVSDEAEVEIPAPTAVVIGTYTVTVTPTANATYAAVYNEGGAAVEFENDVAAVTVGKTITITATPASGYAYADTPTGWTAGQDGKITIEVSAEATVAIPAPTATSTYPSYIDPTDAEETAKYTAWATYAEVSDVATGEVNEEAYLLNCKPSEVAAAKAAFKFTSISYDSTQSKWVTPTTTSYNNRDYNGEVVVKQYSDVGCTTESSTGTFFKASLQ